MIRIARFWKTTFVLVCLAASLFMMGCSDSMAIDESGQGDSSLVFNEIKQDIEKEIEVAINSDPISTYQLDDALRHFRPTYGQSGRVSRRIVAVELRSCGVEGETGYVEAERIYEQYYLDGTVDKRRDSLTIRVEKQNDKWKIVEVKMPI